MTKKEDFQKELQQKIKAGVKPSQIKKSRSAEDLKSKPQASLEVKELQAQITALLEQISRIKQETNQSIRNQEATIKKLTESNNKLTDHNNELRLGKLKSSDQLSTSQKNEDNYFTKYQSEQQLNQQLKLQLATLQKNLTITQQDLKSAQRVIELRLTKPASKDSQASPFDYWTYLRIGALALLIYLLSQDQEK